MGIARLGDYCTGHTGYPPRPCIEASSNVFVNGLGAAREGDYWDIHCNGDSCHAGYLIGNTGNNVYINDFRCGISGDWISCGSRVSGSSFNVYAYEP